MTYLCHSFCIWLKVLIVNTPPTRSSSGLSLHKCKQPFLWPTLPARVIKWQKMVADSGDRERKKKAPLSFGRFSCLTWPSAKRYHSRLITLPLTISQINCPFPQTWRRVEGGLLWQATFSFSPSIECQVVYWLPVFWLASLQANLTAGRRIVLDDESVCFWKVFSFLLNLKDGRAGGKTPQQNEEDMQDERDRDVREELCRVY